MNAPEPLIRDALREIAAEAPAPRPMAAAAWQAGGGGAGAGWPPRSPQGPARSPRLSR